jgi:Family of unknown function (DUF6065)
MDGLAMTPTAHARRVEDVIHEQPSMSFFRMIPGAPFPRRAERSAGSLIPTRALRYCDPVTTATAYGWWLFPPMGFSLMWDGSTRICWSPENGQAWYPLNPAAQFPDFAQDFATWAPNDIARFSPPFLATAMDPGLVQIWTGWVVRTRPGWSSLIKAPANFPRNQGLDHFEGIIETDTWFGPLFTNVRLTKTDVPIEFPAGMPLLQVVPIFREHYSDGVLEDVTVQADRSDWTEQEWSSFRHTVVEPQLLKERPPGLHATEVRIRRKRR